MFGYLLLIIAAVAAAWNISGQLMGVSAAQAKKKEKETGKSRALELGLVSKLIFAAILFAIFFVITLVSRLGVIGNIVGIVASLGVVYISYLLGNLKQKRIFNVVVLWLAVVVASLMHSNLMIGGNTWYIWVQVVLFIVALVITPAARVAKFVAQSKKQDEDEDDDYDEDEDDESSKKKLRFAVNIGGMIAVVAIFVSAIIYLEMTYNVVSIALGKVV